MTMRLKASFIFLALLWLGVILFTFQRAWDNPRLIDSINMAAPLVLLPTNFATDRYVHGTLQGSDEEARARARPEELRAAKAGSPLLVYRTGDSSRPFMTSGQIGFMLPVFDFGVVKLSWRVFLGLGCLLLYPALIWLYRRFNLARATIEEAALLLAPISFVLLVGTSAYIVVLLA